MNLFAHVNQDNIVVDVVVGETAVSLNCRAIEYWEDGGLRKNPATIGYTYDPGRDAFMTPQPHPSWVLDDMCQWQAPVPKPDDGKLYIWKEPTLEWVERVEDVPLSPTVTRVEDFPPPYIPPYAR